jgi:hypothetical protein
MQYPPCIASNWDILGLQICPSCDANVAWADLTPARDSGNAADAFWGLGAVDTGRRGKRIP